MAAAIHSLRERFLSGVLPAGPAPPASHLLLVRKAGNLSGGCHVYDLLLGLEPLPSTQPRPSSLSWSCQPRLQRAPWLPFCFPTSTSRVNLELILELIEESPGNPQLGGAPPGGQVTRACVSPPFCSAHPLLCPLIRSSPGESCISLSLGFVSLAWHAARAHRP